MRKLGNRAITRWLVVYCVVFWAVACFAIIGCCQGVPCDEVREPIHNYADGLNIAQAERRPLLVFVTQKLCPPCKVAKRVIEQMRQDDELDRCVLVEIDAAEGAARAMVVGRKLSPQLILFDMRSKSTDGTVQKHAIEIVDKPRIVLLISRLKP